MSFTSLTFIFFLAGVLIVYWLARRREWQNLVLLAASLVFYGWIHPWYVVLIGASTLADFFLGQAIASNAARSRRWLMLGLVHNLGVLAFFKYYDFFNEALAARLMQAGLEANFLLVNILLPAGLSFYTIKKIIYLLDVSRGTFQPIRSLVDFSLYVSFLPQVVAGPIDRPQLLLPQIQASRAWNWDFLSQAWPLLVMGFFKKIVIADTIQSIVNRIASLDEPSRLMALLGALGFSLQLLADFSAYTDISRGTARLFGYQTSENFNRPYLATTPSEFWNRWHITLSNFLRDYIFFPLRRAMLKAKTYPVWLVQAAPPMLTMLVSGLWHGAGATFLLWGAYHGLLSVGYQLAGIQGDWKPANPLKRLAAWLVMFALIVFGWLIFRAPSIEWVGQIVFIAPWINSPEEWIMGAVVVSMLLFYSLPLLIKIGLDKWVKPDSWWMAGYYAILTIMVIIYINSSTSDFIYFQF